MSETDSIKFNCNYCDSKISVGSAHAGKKGRCPKCKNVIIVPRAEPKEPAKATALDDLLDRDEGYKLKDEPVPDSQEKSLEEKLYEESKSEETEPTGQRKLPWFIDIFLYPIGVSGLVHLVLLSFFPLKLIPMFSINYWYRPPIFGLGLMVVYTGYFFYCLFAFIRDSSAGNTRAPEVEISANIFSDVWEIISPVFIMFVDFLFCIVPLLVYYFITKRIDVYFGLLAVYAIFFSPMVFMATVLFDSFRALNPVLIIFSFFSVFFPYIGLVVILCVFVGAIALIIMLLPPAGIVCYILSAFCIYLSMVMSHILGRFVFIFREKLNWEV